MDADSLSVCRLERSSRFAADAIRWVIWRVSTTALYDSRKSIMTGADRNQFVLNPT